jgi:hypothetical protein
VFREPLRGPGSGRHFAVVESQRSSKRRRGHELSISVDALVMLLFLLYSLGREEGSHRVTEEIEVGHLFVRVCGSGPDSVKEVDVDACVRENRGRWIEDRGWKVEDGRMRKVGGCDKATEGFMSKLEGDKIACGGFENEMDAALWKWPWRLCALEDEG